MNTARTGSIIDEIISGSKDGSALMEFVPSLDADGLGEVLSLIRENVLESEDVAALASWTRLTADLLLAWAVTSRFDDPEGSARADVAGKVAAAAAEIFRADLDDADAAEAARIAASILSLNSRGLASVYERYGSRLDDDTRVRLLKLLAGSGDAEFNRRFGPELAAALAESRRKSERSAVIDKMRTGLKKGRTPEKLRDAVELLEQALRDEPHDAELRSLYSSSMIELGQSETADRLFMELAGSCEGPLRAGLLVEAAQIQMAAGLGGPGASRAPATLEAAIEADRSNEKAAGSYLAVLRETGRLERAVTFLESIRRDATGTAAEPSILKWQGSVLMELGRDDDAEKVWRRLRAINPRSFDALEFYVWYHGRKADWQKQFATLQFELSIVESDEDRIRINRAMADVAENRLNNLDRAAEAYKRILALMPEDDMAFEALVALLEKSSKWHALVELYNDRIRRLPQGEVEGRVALLFRIVEIYQHPDRQPSQESMLAAYARIVEISPTNLQALDTLARGYEDSERWPDLLKVLQKKVDITDDTAELLELFQRISEIAINRMSNETQAIPFLEKILELDPQNLDVVQKLKTIYRHKHNQEKVYSMLRRELEMVSGPDREQVLLSAAAMARDRLLRHDEALSLYEEAYRINGNCREARENMHQLYTRLEKWKDYAAFLKSEVECPMPLKRRIELLHKLGEVCLDRMGDVAEAGTVYSRILELDGGDDIASRRLEQIYLDREDFDSVLAIYRRRNDVRRFVAVLSQRESREESQSARKAINLILSKACEEDLREPARALDFLEQAFVADPGDSSVGRRLAAAARERRDLARVERTLTLLAKEGLDPESRKDDLLALFAMYSDSGRAPEAFDAISSAIRLDPEASDVRNLTESAMKTASDAGLWQQAAELLESVSAGTADAAWRKELLGELGSIYRDRLLFHDEARSAFERVLDIDPEDGAALDILENIALQQEDYTSLEDVLRRRLAASSDNQSRRAIFMSLGRLYEDLLGDDTLAADSYLSAMNLSAEPDRSALAGLHRTFERSERFAELADIIRGERALAQTDWERVRLDCELASVLAENLDQVSEALEILDVVLADGSDEGAVALVRGIFDSGRDTEEAGRIIAAWYSRNEMWADLVGVIETRLERTTEPAVRASLLAQSGSLRMERFNDADRAFEDFAAAVAAVPAPDYVEGMIRLAADTGRFAEAAAAIEGWVSIADPGEPESLDRPTGQVVDAGQEAVLCRTLGQLYGRRLGEPAKAVRALEKALPFEGGDPAFLSELLSLYRVVEDVDSAMSTFDRLADIQEADERRRTLIEKALFASAHGLVDEAIRTVRALAAEGFDPEADAMLEDLLSDHGRYSELIEHLEYKSLVPQYSDEAGSIYFRIASIYREHMNLPGEAATFIARAIKTEPQREEFLLFAEGLISERAAGSRPGYVTLLAELLEGVFRGRPDASDRLMSALSVRAEMCDSPDVCVDILVDMADIENARGNRNQCLELLCRALSEEPANPDLLDRVIQTAVEAGAVRTAVDRLLAISAEAPDEAAVRLRMAAAAASAEHLGDHAAAVDIYTSLTIAFPGHLEILKALDSVLSGMGNDAARIPLLDRMAELAASLEDKREIRLDAAMLALRAGETASAIDSLNFVTDSRPDEDKVDALAAEAAGLLIEAAEKVDDPVLSSRTHLLLGRCLEDQSRRRGHMITAAGIIHSKLGDPGTALGVYLEVLDAFPGDLTARNAARTLARETDDTVVLLGILRDDVETAEDDIAKNAALLEIAKIHARPDVRDAGAALQALREIIGNDPRHDGALSTAVSFFDDPAYAGQAAAMVEEAAEIADNRSLLVDALNVLVNLEQNPRRKASLLRRIGKCCIELGRHSEAVAALGAAFLQMPLVDDSFATLYDELVRQQKQELVVEWVNRACETLSDSVDDRNGLRLKAAARLSESAALYPQAKRLLTDALDQKRDDRAAISALADIALRTADWELYVRMIREKIALVFDRVDEKADAWLECASVYLEKLERPADAEACYREVLAIRPLDREAIDQLESILGAAGDSEGLRQLWHDELGSQEEVRADRRDEERIAWLRMHIAASALKAGAHQEALDMAFRMMDQGRFETDCADSVAEVYRATLDPVLFRALAGMLDRLNDARRLLDLYRFAAGRNLKDPDVEYCLRHAVEIEETLELDDLRFDDLVRLVGVAPEDAETRRSLEVLGRKTGRTAEVTAALEAVFQANQDKAVAYDLAVSLAAILEKDDDRREEAAAYLRVAFLRRPEDQKVVNRLADIYQSLGRYGELALLYENIGDLADDPAERVANYFKAYEVVRHSVENPEGAAEILKKVLDSDPDNAIAIEHLETICRELENYTELVVWIGRKAEITDDSAEKRSLLLEKAEILSIRLGRRDEAVAVLESMVESTPADEDAWNLLERTRLDMGDYEAIADMYVRRANAAADPATRLGALKKAASIYEGRLEDRFAAMQVLKDILSADPSDRYAFVRLSELLESSGDYERLIDLYKDRLRVTTVSSDQVDLNTQIARVWNDRLGDSGAAVAHFKAALAIDPWAEAAAEGLFTLATTGDIHAMEAAVILESVFEATAEFGRLAEILGVESGLLPDPAERAAVLVRLANVHIEKLKAPADGLKVLGEALMATPADTAILDYIGKTAAANGLWASAYDLTAPAAEVCDDDFVAAAVHRAAGDMAMDHLANPALASAHYTAYLGAYPDDAVVLGRLEEAYGLLNRRDDQARVLRRRIGAAGDDAESGMRLRLASILMEEASDFEGAFEQVRAVLAADPVNPDAIRLMSNLSAEPIVGRHAMDALRRAFIDSRDDNGLLWAVEAQIDRSHETADLIELHGQAAAAAARLERTSLEMTHLGAALALDPSDEGLLERTLAAANRSRDGRAAWTVFMDAAHAASWPDLEKKLILSAVRVAGELGFETGAELETALKRVLEIDPSSREALDALDDSYSSDGRIDDLIRILRHRLKLDLGVSERIDVLLRIAGLHETRREFKPAADALEEAASLGAADIDTLKRLRRCYEQTDDVLRQVDTIDRLSAATPDASGRMALLLESAGLQENVLHDLQAARATLERVVSMDQGNVAARVRLESIYERLEEWEPLVRLLGYAAESDAPVDERVRSALKASWTAENRLDNMTVALALARKAAQIDPGASQVIDELLRLYFKTEDWTSLISIIRRKASNESDETEKVLLLSRAGDIARDKLGDIALAGTIAREILNVNPSHPEALLSLAMMMEQRDQDIEALKLYRRLGESRLDENNRIEGLLGAARILMKRGESGDEVRSALQEAASINPKHPSVNKFLKQVYSERGDFAKVVEVLQRDLKNVETDEERAAICMDIAEIYLKKLNQGDKFIQYAEEAHRYRKDDPRVVAGIVKFHLKAGNEQKAVPYLEWLVNYLEAKRRLRELPPYAHELGRILEASGDTTRAVEYYRICHEHDATNITNTLALARLHIRHDDHEKAMRVLQPLLLRIDSFEPAVRSEILLSIARIHETRGDVKKARQFVTRLLSDQPDNGEAREFLSRL